MGIGKVVVVGTAVIITGVVTAGALALGGSIVLLWLIRGRS